jgi:hypothetical protein
MGARRWHLQLFRDDAAKTLLLYIFLLFFRGVPPTSTDGSRRRDVALLECAI